MRTNAFIKLVASMLSLMALLGCGCTDTRGKKQDAVLNKSYGFNRCYLSEDIESARSCLQQNAALLEQATILEPIGRTELLSLTYSRLFALERRAGNSAAADANLIKIKFWILKQAELERRDLDASIKEIDGITPERLMAHVDDTDKKFNHGDPAAYVAKLTAAHRP